MHIRPIPSTVCILSATILTISASCTQSQRESDTPVSTRSDLRPQIIAIINGTPITRDQIQDDLSERAGKQAILDLVLDQQLDLEIRRQHIQIAQSDLEHEESILLSTIADENSPTMGYKVLDAIRSSRGMGANRYPRFLRRNAMLRKLIGQSGQPSEAELDLAEQIAFGPRYQVRLFVGESESSGAQLRRNIISSPDLSQRWIFAQECSTNSIHPSAARGGLIPDLSPVDPGYPSVITNAIMALSPGEISGILSTDAGYAIVLIESIIPATAPSHEQARSIREQLTFRKQSLEMQRLADELIRSAEVTVMDRALNWNWTNRQ